MQMLSFLFVAVTVLVAGYGVAIQTHAPAFAAGLSGAGLAVCFAFGVVDHRTRLLIKESEKPLKVLEDRLASQTGIASLEMVRNVEKADPTWSSYTRVIRSLLVLIGFLMAIGLVYGVAGAASATPSWPAGTATPSPVSSTP